MTKKPKKPRDSKYAFLEMHQGEGDGYWVGFCEKTGKPTNIIRDRSTKEIEDLHRWLGDCIRYIKYRQRKK